MLFPAHTCIFNPQKAFISDRKKSFKMTLCQTHVYNPGYHHFSQASPTGGINAVWVMPEEHSFLICKEGSMEKNAVPKDSTQSHARPRRSRSHLFNKRNLVFVVYNYKFILHILQNPRIQGQEESNATTWHPTTASLRRFASKSSV